MKMNRKILFSISAISSVATVPLLAAKCGNTQGLDKVIKTLNLGEINVYEPTFPSLSIKQENIIM
ncbi:variable surface lipoprotein [Mycoplasmopsis bovis]|nr:variable surface lipoprotein [Mycoplasmopsis bovis]UTW26246.1 variable surface lipoprotein [Mycoplasmopsis bovis]